MKLIGQNLKDGSQVCFESISDACEYLQLDGSHIRKCLNGTRKSHGGYSWRFKRISDKKAKILLSVKKEKVRNLGELSDNNFFDKLFFEPEIWSEEEDALIKRYYPLGDLSILVSKLAKDVSAISLRAKMLGLKRGQIHPSNRSAQDIIDIVVSAKETSLDLD